MSARLAELFPPRLVAVMRLLSMQPRSLNRAAVVERLHEVLVGSLPLVTVTLACIGASMCDQAARQALRLLGDQSFIGPEYIVLGFEEYGPLAVAMAFSARIGAGFAAEVATLSSEDTLDAVDFYGGDTVRNRLAPMAVACVVGCVFLGLIGVLVWELAGIVTMATRHDVNPLTFFRLDSVRVGSVVLNVTKNASFGLAVFFAATSAGLTARGGADQVGAATTRAVVRAVVLCLMVNLFCDWVWFTMRGPA